MRIVETGYDPTSERVDDPGVGPNQRSDIGLLPTAVMRPSEAASGPACDRIGFPVKMRAFRRTRSAASDTAWSVILSPVRLLTRK